MVRGFQVAKSKQGSFHMSAQKQRERLKEAHQEEIFQVRTRVALRSGAFLESQDTQVCLKKRMQQYRFIP